jgi:MFS family permease
MTSVGASLGAGNRRLTFVVLSLAVTAFLLIQVMVLPVLANIESAFHTSESVVTWTLTGYLLSASVFTPIMGRIGDAYGKRRLLVISLACLAIGSVVAASAATISVLIVGRVLQGVGGGILPLSFGIVRDTLPPELVAHSIAALTTVSALGTSIGTIIAGPIVTYLGLSWLFWVPAILTGAAAVAAEFLIPESPVRASRGISVLPGILLSGWLVAFLLALSQAPEWGWASARVLGLTAAAAVLAYAWVRAELHARTPLVDMRMMRIPAVWSANLTALLLGLAFYASIGFIPRLLEAPTSTGYGLGVSITQASLITLPFGVVVFVIGQFTTPLTHRFGARPLIVIGSMLAGLAMLLVALAHGHVWEMVAWNALLGLALGVSFPSLAAMVVAAVPPEQTGVASGMNANIRTVGGSIGSALMATILLEVSGERGWVIGFVVLGAGFVASAGAGLLIPAGGRPARAPGEVNAALPVVPGGPA